MDDSYEEEEIELVPFIHQVGGHSFMLSLDEATVCKALIPRELQFYQTLPGIAQKFTPVFYGITRVRTVVDHDENVRFYAACPKDYRPRAPSKSKVRFKKSGIIELLSNEGLFLEDSTSGSSTPSSSINPWVLTCHQQYMDRFRLRPANDNPADDGGPIVHQDEERDFIVLENLVWHYSCPCVLDLKMGTRQYGDSASLAKKQSKMVKVVSTTSAKLGLRVGGMQVYQSQSGRFLCRNKFYGRSLSVAGFQQAIVQFLHNGLRLRTDVLAALIVKLEELVTVINKLEATRLYTTSLLLLYEGLDSGYEDDSEQIGAVSSPDLGAGRRGSDDEHGRKTSSTENLSHTNSEGTTPCFSTKRRTSSAANLEVSTPSGASSTSSSSSTIFEETPCKLKGRSDSFRGRSFSTKSDPGGGVKVVEPKVDVKLIDFAHSTNKELDDVVVYAGPDKGFLFGVETLINMLKAIENDYG